MKHFYNAHHIEVVVWLDGDGWRVSVLSITRKKPETRL